MFGYIIAILTILVKRIFESFFIKTCYWYNCWIHDV